MWRALAGLSLAGAVASTVGATGMASYLARRITSRPRTHRPAHFSFTPWEVGLAHENVEIPVEDAFLSGWFIPQEDESAPVILGLSGHGGTKSDLLGISARLHADGFSVLLFDFRGAGQSPGSIRTLGHNETLDARAALDWLASRVTGPIGILGYSLGGSIALMLAASDPRISAVVSDSGFAAQREILAHHVRRKTGLWPGPVLSIAGPMLSRRHGKTYDDFAPLAIADQISPRPLLLIHSKDDQIVPFQHALDIWERAREPKEAWFPEEAGHCGAYFQDRPGYCQRITGFFNASLKAGISVESS